MLSQYFKYKTTTNDFVDNTNKIIVDLSKKKIVVYGFGEGFIELNKKYDFFNKINIIAIADKKFNDIKVKTAYSEKYKINSKLISPIEIQNEDFDYILVTNEVSRGIYNYLIYDLNIKEEIIKLLFREDIYDEAVNYNYLCQYNFAKHIKKLTQKLKNKKIVLYGAGAYLEVIKKYYDLSGLNIIGIADLKFENNMSTSEFLGYKTYTPEELKTLDFDYLLVSTKMYMKLMMNLYYETYENAKFKIKPLVKKNLFHLIQEIF